MSLSPDSEVTIIPCKPGNCPLFPEPLEGILWNVAWPGNRNSSAAKCHPFYWTICFSLRTVRWQQGIEFYFWTRGLYFYPERMGFMFGFKNNFLPRPATLTVGILDLRSFYFVQSACSFRALPPGRSLSSFVNAFQEKLLAIFSANEGTSET